MDIDYLLMLQGLREQLGSGVESALSAISLVGDGPGLIAIVLLVYWCIDKKSGQLAIAAFCLGNFVSQLVKNIACVYRPWVRDPRVIPAASAIEGAGGYSFPSGHVTGTTTTIGTLGLCARKSRKWITVICVLFILVMAFSRNYLGVHTPQDVLVALAWGCLAIFLTTRLERWLQRNPNRDVTIVVIAFIVAAASLVFIMLKPYPLDYVNGQLLVDPAEMQKGSFVAAGVVMGTSLGWLLERRHVQFTTSFAEIGMGERLARAVIGVAIAGGVYVVLHKVLKVLIGPLWGDFITMFALTLIAMFVVPLLFERIFARRRTKAARGAHAAR